MTDIELCDRRTMSDWSSTLEKARAALRTAGRRLNELDARHESLEQEAAGLRSALREQYAESARLAARCTALYDMLGPDARREDRAMVEAADVAKAEAEVDR